MRVKWNQERQESNFSKKGCEGDILVTLLSLIYVIRLKHGWSSHHFSILGRVAPLCNYKPLYNYKPNTNKLLNNHKKEHILLKLKLSCLLCISVNFYHMLCMQIKIYLLSSNYFLQSPIMWSLREVFQGFLGSSVWEKYKILGFKHAHTISLIWFLSFAIL